MKLDRKTLIKISSMPDKALFSCVSLFLGSVGITLSRSLMTRENAAALREVLLSLDERDIARIGEICAIFKKRR